MKKLALPLCLALAACSAPPATPEKAKVVVPERDLVAEVRASGVEAEDALDVQPLRDPEVQDLREAAASAVAARNYAAAAEALNHALLIVADDPAVLQERAEVALLQADNERAEALSRPALDLGSRVGPLGLRHWATIAQARPARGPRQGAGGGAQRGRRAAVDAAAADRQRRHRRRARRRGRAHRGRCRQGLT